MAQQFDDETTDTQTRKIRCEIFSRVTGYLRPTSSWNLGKKAEFKDRKTYDLSKSLTGHEEDSSMTADREHIR